jgi:hypothetical protein
MNANPHPCFRPGELWFDDHGVHINAHGGGIAFHEGVYYWIGEHKIESEEGNRSHIGLHLYSSTDLYHWKDEGIALQVSDDPQSDIVRGCVMERPKLVRNPRTGKWIIWFHLEKKSQLHHYQSARSGVAIGDKPTGPFVYLESFRPNPGIWPMNGPCEPITDEEYAYQQDVLAHKDPEIDPSLFLRRDFKEGQMARDMTIFVDDDQKAYHIYSSEENGTLHIAELSDDYLKHSGRYIRILPGRKNEAPAILKRQGLYWLFTSGCTGWTPNEARLAVAPSIWGPWRPLDTPFRGLPGFVATTFDSQPTCILTVAGNPDAHIYMGDRWRGDNAIDGRYVWLPINFREGRPEIGWKDQWDLRVFDAPPHPSPSNKILFDPRDLAEKWRPRH